MGRTTYFPIAFLLLVVLRGWGQDIGKIGKAKLVSVTGGVSANAVYYEGNAQRAPFTYFLNGNLNLNISDIYNIPLSFSYSNQDFGVANPFSFNRLSIHPSYKWVTTHIGDVNMSFSPYTLNGHKFTGLGVDLVPEGAFKISAMYGRLLKATEFNAESPNSIPAYDRFGFGFKVAYQFEKWHLGLIFFKATDNERSLDNQIPSTLGVAPKDNAVVSIETGVTLFDKAQLDVEYAISGITEDTQLTEPEAKSHFLSSALNANITTQYYNAVNIALSYPVGRGSLSARYERIDPEYRTLGAYFFNNDLENVTANASQTIFNDKVSISANVGVQRDNLNKVKTTELQRVVTAVNTTITVSEKLNLNISYSNFQSFTNIRNQFDFINEVGQFDNIDTLNYRQISENINLGVNYLIKKTENKAHSATLNLLYQDAKNLQNEVEQEEASNAFYNATAAYNLGFPKKALQVSLAANSSFNRTQADENLIFGPTLSISKQFFDKTLRSNISSAYNTSYANGNQSNSVLNFRLGNSYTWKERHNFNLNLLAQLRQNEVNTATDFTATLGYSYSFDRIQLKRKLVANEDAKKGKNYVSFRYNDVTYSGSIASVTRQITTVYKTTSLRTISLSKRDELEDLLIITSQQELPQTYKDSAIQFLKQVHAYSAFETVFNATVYNVIQKIVKDMTRVDPQLERSYVRKKTKLNKTINVEKKQILKKELEQFRKGLLTHRWMQQQFNGITASAEAANTDPILQTFKKAHFDAVFERYETQDPEKIKLYLETQIISFYTEKAKTLVGSKSLELDKTQK